MQDICENLGLVVDGVNLGHITLFTQGSDCPFLKKYLVRSIIFEILFYVAATTKNIFWVKNGVKLVHLSVAPTFFTIAWFH